MILRFCLRVGNARQLRKEALLCVDADKMRYRTCCKRSFYFVALVFAHQTVVNKHTGQLARR